MGAAPISDEERKYETYNYETKTGTCRFSWRYEYNHRDLRNVLERSSARETAARVAVGALCKVLLEQLDIEIYSRVVEIGGIKDKDFYDSETFKANLDRNDVRVIDDGITSNAR